MPGFAICAAKAGSSALHRQQTKEELVPKGDNGRNLGKMRRRARDTKARDKEHVQDPGGNNKIGIKETINRVWVLLHGRRFRCGHNRI